MQTLLMKNLKPKPFVFSVKIGCISGYIGKNCRSTCAYPYYGVDFQGQCDCDEESRDFSTGSWRMYQYYKRNCISFYTRYIFDNKLLLVYLECPGLKKKNMII